MKRQIILILTLVLLIVLTGGTYFAVDHYQKQKNEKAAEEAKALSLFQYDADSINAITLETPDGTFHAARNADNEWELTDQDADFAINTYYLNSVANAFANLTATRNMGEATEENKSKYGLDDPTIITCSDGTSEYTVYAGKQTATGEAYYIMVDGKSDIYLADADTYGSYLTINKNSLKYIYIYYDQNSDINAVRLERDQEVVFDISSSDEGLSWQMNAPAKGNTVNAAAMSSLLTSIKQTIVTGFGDENVTPDQYAKYGFDQPYYVLTFTQLNGNTSTYYALKYDNLKDSYVTFLDVNHGQILYIEPSYVSFLASETADMLERNLCNVTIDQVAAVDFTIDDVSAHMDIDYANQQYTVNDTVIDSNNVPASNAFMTFYDALRGLSYNSMDLIATIPSDAKPTVSITYTLLDGTKQQVDLIPIDDTTYWAIVNGKYTGYITRRYQISDRNGILPAYQSLLDILSEDAA